MKFVSAIRTLSVASLALAPLLAGCQGEPEAVRGVALTQLCSPAPVEIVYNNDFSSPLPADWSHFVDKPTQDPGHTWAVVNGQLVSDPAGSTIGDYYNRVDTPPFDLTGKGTVRVRYKQRFSQTGLYQVFVQDGVGHRSLVRDYGAFNPDYPLAQFDEFAIPDFYQGKPDIKVSFVLWNGGGGGSRTGVEIDELQLLVNGQAGSVAFFDDFEGPTLSKWNVYNAPAPGTPGHVWERVQGNNPCFSGGYAWTDSAGGEIDHNYTRMVSQPFSLAGKTSAQLTFQRSFLLAGRNEFQVYFSTDDQDSLRGLAGEYFGGNASFPGNDTVTMNVPSGYLGRSKVRVEFLVFTGTATGAYGVAIDNVAVTAQ